ncbi:hypothetical protein IFM89_033774 [Coptis chinensis]|uniref:Serine/threonine specific protein phosphatases domain-containing protein n=1 Tax=Coptis chinensis TaxID=261450 RepID=A0A835HR44_9MAGN|nr:hypothetical protein IFM89_033774 [Coptis chinensis]
MIRGNHECQRINKKYGFEKECNERSNNLAFKGFIDLREEEEDMVFSTMIRSIVAASPPSFIKPPKPSIRTQRSSESTEDATLTDVLRSFSSETSTKAIIKKISADVAQLLLAHAFQKKNYCVMGDVYRVLLVPKELELEKDTSFIAADLKFQLPNVGKATKEFFRSKEVREFFSRALAGAMTKVVLGPLETIRAKTKVFSDLKNCSLK